MASKLETSGTPGEAQGIPVYCLSDVRHRDGVTLIQALVRNVRTCHLDEKRETQVEAQERESTDAGHRDGVACNSDEGSVMELERRGDIVQL